MKYPGLRIARDTLWRILVIGVLIAVLQAVATLVWWDTWVNLVVTRWHMIDSPEPLKIITAAWFGGLRFFLAFFVLTPALALHWTIKSLERSGES